MDVAALAEPGEARIVDLRSRACAEGAPPPTTTSRRSRLPCTENHWHILFILSCFFFACAARTPAWQDRVDVLEVVAEVELLGDLGVGEVLLSPRDRPSAGSGNRPRRATPASRCAGRGDRRPREKAPFCVSAISTRCEWTRPPRLVQVLLHVLGVDQRACRPRRRAGSGRSRGVTVASGPIMRSAEECEMSRSCHSATFSMARHRRASAPCGRGR